MARPQQACQQLAVLLSALPANASPGPSLCAHWRPLRPQEARGSYALRIVRTGSTESPLSRCDNEARQRSTGAGMSSTTSGLRPHRPLSDAAGASTEARDAIPDSQGWTSGSLDTTCAHRSTPGLHIQPKVPLIGWCCVFEDRPAGWIRLLLETSSTEPGLSSRGGLREYFRPGHITPRSTTSSGQKPDLQAVLGLPDLETGDLLIQRPQTRWMLEAMVRWPHIHRRAHPAAGGNCASEKTTVRPRTP